MTTFSSATGGDVDCAPGAGAGGAAGDGPAGAGGVAGGVDGSGLVTCGGGVDGDGANGPDEKYCGKYRGRKTLPRAAPATATTMINARMAPGDERFVINVPPYMRRSAVADPSSQPYYDERSMRSVRSVCSPYLSPVSDRPSRTVVL
jgi:hypothetical protein